MDEERIYEAFGLEPEEPETDEDENEAEEAGGEDVAEDAGEVEPEDEETGEDDVDEDDQDVDGDGDDEDEDEPRPMDKAERARQAAARRARERQAAIDEALARGRAEERERLNRLLKASGMKNPLDKNSGIEDVDAFEKYVQAAGAAREELRDRRVGSGQGSADDIREIVSEAVERHPAIIRARELEAEAEREQQRAMAERVKAKTEAQIREISEAYDPDIKNIEDILAMDTADSFKDYVKKGLNFVDAYKLANYEAIAAREAAKGQRQAASLAASKKHLSSTRSRGAGGVEVPAEVKAYYRKLIPDITDKEIAAHYAREGRR